MFWMGPPAWKKGIVYTTEKLTGLGANDAQLARAKASTVWNQTHAHHCPAQWTISSPGSRGPKAQAMCRYLQVCC